VIAAHEWHFWVDDLPRPGWTNMAIDQALLEQAEHGRHWLRLYSWEPHCLSFGCHEPANRRFEAARIAALGIDTVRRPTGGRAVWHSRELTYALAAPCHSFGSLPEAYLEIHRVVAAALLALGLQVSLAQATPALPLDAGACFAHAAGGEIMVGPRKLVGSAQLRRGGALLQHGSILLQDEQRVVAALTRDGISLVPEDSSPSYETPLSGPDLIEAIYTAALTEWQGSWHRISGSDETLQAAARHYPKFRSPAWTWRR
jgi:lipoyl(octanoyl) transferase